VGRDVGCRTGAAVAGDGVGEGAHSGTSGKSEMARAPNDWPTKSGLEHEVWMSISWTWVPHVTVHSVSVAPLVTTTTVLPNGTTVAARKL